MNGSPSQPWLFHIDDEDRRIAYEKITQACEAAEREIPRSNKALHRSATDVTIRAAIEIDGGRHGARFVHGPDQCSLYTPSPRLAHRRRLLFRGPSVPAEQSADARGVALATLAFWRDRLAEEPSPDEVAAADEVRRTLASLLLGAVERLDIRWGFAQASIESPGAALVNCSA